METRNKINVLIADNHEVALLGLQTFLSIRKDITVRAVAHHGKEIFCKIQTFTPDVVVMDNNFNDFSCKDVIEYTSKYSPNSKLIIYSSSVDEQGIMKYFEAGVSGYVSKNTKPKNLLDAIRTVYHGEKYLEADIADMFIRNYFKPNMVNENTKRLQFILTKTEIKILKFIGEGLSNYEIAKRIGISHRTVECHRRNISLKLKITGTAKLVNFAIKNNVDAIHV